MQPHASLHRDGRADEVPDLTWKSRRPSTSNPAQIAHVFMSWGFGVALLLGRKAEPFTRAFCRPLESPPLQGPLAISPARFCSISQSVASQPSRNPTRFSFEAYLFQCLKALPVLVWKHCLSHYNLHSGHNILRNLREEKSLEAAFCLQLEASCLQ